MDVEPVSEAHGNAHTQSRSDGVSCPNVRDALTSMFGFLNPRLSMAPLHSFLGRFVQLVCVHAKPVRVALVEAYTRDEEMRAHTDVVWFCPSRVVVLRYAPPRTRPFGISLPDVATFCVCGNTGTPLGQTPAVKRWVAGRVFVSKTSPALELPFHTSCCNFHLRLKLPNGGSETARNAGVTFVKALWPALPVHTRSEPGKIARR